VEPAADDFRCAEGRSSIRWRRSWPP